MIYQGAMMELPLKVAWELLDEVRRNSETWVVEMDSE
jgi:hypothetical protein